MAINKPSVEELTQKTPSTYTLVIEVAKRTRELVDGAQPLIEGEEKKPISTAIDEIQHGLITFHRNLEDED